ncbi:MULTISPECIES: sigma-54 dependent transcriptional regulator [Limibacillus]|jgi:two-component system nitrogen regulation response regulator NtrX|uniref:Two-component system nitrogen regulation response regulator NtrX n=1 Tax=Limibacillus halophilus TaxID=1579333 RepID=A0A839SW62_9PROT|nr:sigma-54 dependent transcriptional regulator [Limibacillus halophilus]MBB3065924.1 two-component system nitrogen regulation response regulator NtrX [Limibacillus halophilus]
MATEILIVDDESDIRMLIAGTLEDEGYQTRDAANSDAAIAAIQARRPSLVILDIWLNNSPLDGLGILKWIRQHDPDLPIIMISGHGTIETAVKAIKMGAYDFIEKPFDSDRLLLILTRTLEASRLRRENRELKMRAGPEEKLIGKTISINNLRQTIKKVAPTGSRVLITGQAGTGKEVVARCLHLQSRRADASFVVVNCASMHPDRLEEELFGIEGDGEAGRTAKAGTLERAHGGTLLLDEVADMPLETQGKIVRVLQEQTFQRLGGDRRVEVDVRVIASTNRDLAKRIEEGTFREDLYYRLNVVPMKVPPLRERREDIPMLAQHFMQRSAEAAGVAKRVFSEDALAALQSYDWPGNVRQLRNAVEWMLIMGGDGDEAVITADMLPVEIGAITPVILRSEGASELMSLPLRDAREMFERQYLEAQVIRFGGNISRTAAFVGMERSALHRKLRSLGISSSADRH